MLLIAYKQKKMHAWWLMLVLGIVVIFTGRIETAVLLIIASFLYKGSLK
jgi:predicted CDP-diglyceride synthetase/phosphatidate cytidylyltransferase